MSDITTIPEVEKSELVRHANALLFRAEEAAAIESVQDEAKAVEFLTQVADGLKTAKAKLKSYTDPLNDVIKRFRAEADTFINPLEEADKIVRAGIRKFRDAEAFREAEARRKEAEARARNATEHAMETLQEGDIKQAYDAADAVTVANAEAPRKVEATRGSMTTRREWKFEVVAADAIPREYCVPDERLIRAAMKEGIRDIPGVRYWEETVPVIRGRR